MESKALCTWVLDACSEDRPCTGMTLLPKMLQRRVTAVAFVHHGAMDLGNLGVKVRSTDEVENRELLQEQALQQPPSLVLKILKKGSRVRISPLFTSDCNFFPGIRTISMGV